MQFGPAECCAHWARYHPDDTALIVDGKVIKYESLDRLVCSVAVELIAVSNERDRIAIVCSSKLNTLVSILAATRISRSPVVLHVGSGAKLLHMSIQDTKPKAIIHDEYPSVYKSAFKEYDSRNEVRINSIKLLPHESAHQLQVGLSTPRDEWGILFSSGTTGASKGIQRDNYSIVTETIGWCMELGLRRGDTFYIGRPLFYTGGLVLALATLTVGGIVIVDNYEDNDRWSGFIGQICGLVKVDIV